jgi:D-3-phosphoglycerate dehydrogenase / 2-oxoglutarate reductase
MDILIIEPLEPEVMHWLAERHTVHFRPELGIDAHALRQSLFNVGALITPPSVAIDATLLHYAPMLRAVGRLSAGAENIDLNACASRNVELVRSLTASAVAEAEFMVGALLALLRRVPVVNSDGMRVGRELSGATIGIVGMAPSARVLSQLLNAFGSVVVGYDPAVHANDPVWDRWSLEPMALRQLMEVSDGVCVQLSYFSRYQRLIGERFLPYCKPHQVMVSLSPSSLFEESALADALSTGRMSAAWFDSLEPGALASGRPLSQVDNLQVSPRVASTTRESRARAAWAVARRIDELLATTPSRADVGYATTIPASAVDLLTEPELSASAMPDPGAVARSG